ncbi:MAG: NAD(P)H-dependent oxidoreductase [Sandaracinaceae bacterium]
MILVINAHPNPNSFGAALSEAYAEGARMSADIDRLGLADLRFDPVLRAGFDEGQPLEPDLVDARRRIEKAKHVVWFFPTWWVGPPALLKGFIDRTFLPGWAFRYTDGALPDPLLARRSSRVVTTMDSPRWWYGLWHRRAVHAAFVNGTLRFVGFSPVRQTTLYGVRTMSPEKRMRAIEELRRVGRRDAARWPKQLAAESSTASR